MLQKVVCLLLVLTLNCNVLFTVGYAADEENALLLGTGNGSMTASPKLAQTKYQNFISTGEPLRTAENQRMVQIVRQQIGLNGADLGYTEEWCANFVTDIAHAAGVPSSIVPWEFSGRAYVPYLYTYMTQSCGAVPVAVRDALPGDIIFFDWDGYVLDHVAIVVWYDSETDEITYIGGNQGTEKTLLKRTVSEVTKSANDQYIARILRPQYRSSDSGEPSRMVRIEIQTEGGGTVSGAKDYVTGTEASLTALPMEGYSFAGWYDSCGNLVSKAQTYRFSVTEHTRLTALFQKVCTIRVKASRSGSVTGAGTYPYGTEAVLKALSVEGHDFVGWYDSNGAMLSRESVFCRVADANVTVYALFEGDRFCDISPDAWYQEDVMEAAELGIVTGTTKICFEGDTPFTRAMAAVMLKRAVEDQTMEHRSAGFADVPADAWYGNAVNWAVYSGLIQGRTETEFAPNAAITREEFIAMLVRSLPEQDRRQSGGALNYTDVDQISFARRELEIAQAMGMISGYQDGTLRPRSALSRIEGTVLIMRFIRLTGRL